MTACHPRLAGPHGRIWQRVGLALVLRVSQGGRDGMQDQVLELVGSAEPAPQDIAPLGTEAHDGPFQPGGGGGVRGCVHTDLAPRSPDLRQRVLHPTTPGVTVQGPPGTGKSHTIANIISHYVAYGRRVLVVAEKEQALRALANKIPDGIKDLTVAVLGADAESRRELESAIEQNQTRVTAIDKAVADERIRQLTEDLDGVSRRIAVTTQSLVATREAEVEQLPGQWLAGDAPTRAEAARWVASYASEWVTSMIPSLRWHHLIVSNSRSRIWSGQDGDQPPLSRRRTVGPVL